MENEHKEAQERLNEIKRVLVDSDKAAPAPAGMLYAIGVTSIFLNLIMDWIFANPTSSFDAKLIAAVITLAAVSIVAILISGCFIKKENDKLDRIFSKNQRFIITIYAISMLAGSAITMGVVVLGGWALIHFYWSIILGAAAYIFGFFTKKLLSRYGLFLILASIVQIIGAIIYVKSHTLLPCEANFVILDSVYHFGLMSSLVLVGLGHIAIGYIIGKEKNV
jgi:hypothetical protein